MKNISTDIRVNFVTIVFLYSRFGRNAFIGEEVVNSLKFLTALGQNLLPL
jgi:hypothetical protein